MGAKQVILTDEGLKKLEDELDQLKTHKRKEIAEKIKVALSFGDLSENSEYDEAKNEQAMVEARIAQIEVMLKNAKVIDDEDITTDVVSVGAKVKVYDAEFDEEVVYQLVGSTETDPVNNRISDESPIGRGLVGRRVGDTIEVETPGGQLTFVVRGISK